MPSAEASRRNLEKAKAHWRAPRPWRSTQETRVIRRLSYQWFLGEEPRCPLREIARRLGVSQPYIQKLVRQFKKNPPNDLVRVVRGYGGPSISTNGQLQESRVRILATFEELREAREQSERMRARGLLRSRRPRKTAEFKVDDNVVQAVVPTKAQTLPELEADASQARGRSWGGARPGAGRKRNPLRESRTDAGAVMAKRLLISICGTEIDLGKEIRELYRRCAAMPRMRSQIRREWPQFFT